MTLSEMFSRRSRRKNTAWKTKAKLEGFDRERYSKEADWIRTVWRRKISEAK